MTNLAKKLDCDNDALPTSLLIKGPTWLERHPWSDALVAELVKFGWNILRDETGQVVAMHVAFSEGRA